MRQNAPMNRLALLLPLVLAIAACGTPPNEVVALRDGLYRAPTYVQAQAYCSQKNQSMRQRGNAPAETGVNFSCE